MNTRKNSQAGASLIEVLVAILLLSFGMLALGAMMTFAVQSPKLSAYRATAANMAASHVERMRANPEGFADNSYTAALNDSSWSFADIALSDCTYPNCTKSTLATMDINATRHAVRRELPAGDMEMWCSAPSAPTIATTCTKVSQGNLWIIWQEPGTTSLLSESSANCPPDLPSTPARCLYIRFKVE
jgi:type IV pilus assembly protein PilV